MSVTVTATMESLIDASDLLIAPWLLRRHVHEHGLSKDSRSNAHDRDWVFDLATTQSFLDRDIPRYRAAILSGWALRRLPDAEAMYLLGNTGNFDASLRAALTRQMSSMEAIGSFATITVPPGYVSDQASMAEYIDLQPVLGRLAELKATEGLPEDPWVRSSVRRLEATLQARDPHFRDGDLDDD